MTNRVGELRITVLGTRGFPNVQGGIENHCEHLYTSLINKGCQITVFTRKGYVDTEMAYYKGVRLVPLPCLRKKSLEAISHSLCGVLVAKKKGCDILHIHGIGPSLLVPVARVLAMKTVMTNHGPDYARQKWGKLGKFVLRLGEYFGSRWANAIICVSDWIADDIRARYRRDIFSIPNGVVVPELDQNTSTLRRHGLEKNRYIMSVGRLVPEKGFHDLIDAFNKASLDNWRLVIVGGADHPDKYSSELIRKVAENDNIVLPGFLAGEPLQQLYSHAGLFVLPSYYEGLPIVLLEALSYRLSCIASDIPANRKIELAPNRFFGAGNVEELSNMIKYFTNNPLTEIERSIQLEILSKKYDWSVIADETLNVYKAVIGA